MDLQPIKIEQTVWSDVYGYAGTMDLLAVVNGKLTILDWKTSKALHPEYKLQVAAYAKALLEMGHGDVEQMIIVRLPKTIEDPGFEAHTVTESGDELFQVFLHAFALWKWAQIGEAEYQKRRKTAA